MNRESASYPLLLLPGVICVLASLHSAARRSAIPWYAWLVGVMVIMVAVSAVLRTRGTSVETRRLVFLHVGVTLFLVAAALQV